MKRPHDLPPEAARAISLAEFWQGLMAENSRELISGEHEVAAPLRDRVERGELAIWARHKSPLAPFQMIPATAARHLRFFGGDQGCILCGVVTLTDCWIGEPLDAPERPTTGAPGRPTSMHLVLNEHERRRAAGATEKSRAREGEALAEWLKVAHPNQPRLKGKAIYNKLPKSFQPNL